MPESHETQVEKGYRTLEYATDDGGKVGSLSREDLYEVLEGIDSWRLAEQMHRTYTKNQ